MKMITASASINLDDRFSKAFKDANPDILRRTYVESDFDVFVMKKIQDGVEEQIKEILEKRSASADVGALMKEFFEVNADKVEGWKAKHIEATAYDNMTEEEKEAEWAREVAEQEAARQVELAAQKVKEDAVIASLQDGDMFVEGGHFKIYFMFAKGFFYVAKGIYDSDTKEFSYLTNKYVPSCRIYHEGTIEFYGQVVDNFANDRRVANKLNGKKLKSAPKHERATLEREVYAYLKNPPKEATVTPLKAVQ